MGWGWCYVYFDLPCVNFIRCPRVFRRMLTSADRLLIVVVSPGTRPTRFFFVQSYTSNRTISFFNVSRIFTVCRCVSNFFFLVFHSLFHAFATQVIIRFHGVFICKIRKRAYFRSEYHKPDVTNRRWMTSMSNRSFAASHSRDTKPPCRWAKVALGQDKQRKLQFKIMYVFCLTCPCATFAHQHGGFVSREWLAAKGLSMSNHWLINWLVIDYSLKSMGSRWLIDGQNVCGLSITHRWHRLLIDVIDE